MLYSNVNTDFLGKSVSYDENALTDMELVCYYANSDLYELGQADPFTAEVRDAELEKVRTSCDPCLAALEAAQKLGGFTAKLGAPDPVCELPELLIAATRVYEFQGETVTNLEIFKVSGDGQTFVQLTQTPDPLGYTYVHHPAWSPNRDKIAFTWFLDIGEHIFVMDADGENKVALTDSDPEPARHFHPAWSPDGRKIAYVRSSQSGVFEIYVMNADGTDQQKMVTRNGLISEIGWSPDGTKMAFAQWSPDETSDIVVANVVVDVVNDLETWTLENPVTVVSGDINLSPEWSPDGQKILYVHAADLISDRNLFVVETSTLEIQQLTGLNDPNNPGGGQEFVREYDADWSPDGTQIAMMRSGEVWVINADGSDLVQLTPTNANLIVEEVDW
jgi:WD40 repeat protein